MGDEAKVRCPWPECGELYWEWEIEDHIAKEHGEE